MRRTQQINMTSAVLLLAIAIPSLHAQMIDNTQATSTAGAGINKSLTDEVGAGRGSIMTPNSSLYIINRDPFRSIRRGRQLFQRKFTQAQGQGPNEHDGVGDLNTDPGIAAGLTDSCAACHGRPRGSAGTGGNVATRPDSRDAPHLFGLGIREMLADEMTTDLRATRDLAVSRAQNGRSQSPCHSSPRVCTLAASLPILTVRLTPQKSLASTPICA